MSLILDALRKSEQERRQADSLMAPPLTADAVALPRRHPHPFAVVAALLLLIAAASGYWAWLGWREAPLRVESTPAPIGLAERAPPAAAAASEKESNTSSDVPRAPQLTVNPFVGAKRESTAVRDLARETRVSRPEPVPPAAATPAGQFAVTSSASTPAPGAALEPAAVKFLRAMPPEFQRALPELVVNIHIYAPRAAERILYINNRQYHAGDRVRDGIVVEEIVEDGAVLSYRGERFKLPRPS